MDVKEAIIKRRAYRSLKATVITEELLRDLATAASLAPSCRNKQPWRFVFVYEKEIKEKLHMALSPGNEWAYASSMIIAVFSNKELDCQIKGIEYYLFDTGMAVAFLILRATELGLVAHPIAGYDEEKVKTILNIPSEMRVVALIIVGKQSEELTDLLTEKQKEVEEKRPERLPLEAFCYFNIYK
jgi:nitroreductase